MPDRHPVPVVASTGLASLLTGPTRTGAVVGTTPAAAYVHVPGVPRGVPSVVAVEAPRAVGLPCGVGLTRGAPARLPGEVPVGAAVVVGAGRVAVAGTTLAVARWTRARPHLPTIDPVVLRRCVDTARARLPAPRDAIAREVADRTADLATVVSDGDLDGAVAVVGALCGLGPGSTPSGDDVVAGAVAAGVLLATGPHASGPAAEWYARLGARAAALAVGRTTTLSAALLGHAARGEVARPVADLLRALVGVGDVDDALGRLLAVGHRSGADLAAGVLLAAAVACRPPTRVPEVARA